MIVIGDTHGLKPIFKLIDSNNWTGEYLIHVGDLGLGFQEISKDIVNLQLLNQALTGTNNHLYVVRGNHDNPIFFDKSKGLRLPKFTNIHLMDDYELKNIENKNVLFIGGAISLDRSSRIIEKLPSWWEDEKFNYDQKKLNRSLRFNKKLDIIITHSCPIFAYPRNFDNKIVKDWCGVEDRLGNDLLYELKREREDITYIGNDLDRLNQMPDYWVYGHFHSSKEEKIDNTIFKLLNIEEIYEIK